MANNFDVRIIPISGNIDFLNATQNKTSSIYISDGARLYFSCSNNTNNIVAHVNEVLGYTGTLLGNTIGTASYATYAAGVAGSVTPAEITGTFAQRADVSGTFQTIANVSSLVTGTFAKISGSNITGNYKTVASDMSVFFSTQGNITTNANLLFDYTNSQLVVGTNVTQSAANKLYVNGQTTVNGHFYATVKHFKVEDQLKPGSHIVYATIEGPEQAVFYRGTITGNIKEFNIPLPKEWRWLVDENSITVHLTPNDFKTKVIAIYKNNIEITIKSKYKNSNFDFLILGERKDIEKLVVNQ